MSQPRGPRRDWFLFWLLVFGGVFAVGETVAVTDDRPGDTLSESVAYVVAVPPGPSGEVALLAFLAALGWHFTRGKGHRWPFISRRKRGR